jgi:germination protein M
MRKWVPLLALLLLLAGCGKEEEAACQIYYRTSREDPATAAIQGENCALSGKIGEIQAALTLLLSTPEEAELISPFPAGTQVNSWTLDHGQLTVDFSEQYAKLDGVDLSLADYCVVLTLTQFEGVDEVVLTVAGEEVPGRSQQVFHAEDVLLNGDEAQQVLLDVQLSFPLADGSGLGTEYREVLVGEDETPAEALFQALREGPTSQTMAAFLPETEGEVHITVTEEICTVELGEGWELPEDAGQRELTAYALVNSLAELDTVERVEVLLDGQPLWGHGPLTPDYRLSIG